MIFRVVINRQEGLSSSVSSPVVTVVNLTTPRRLDVQKMAENRGF
jgi:hypothetical protein